MHTRAIEFLDKIFQELNIRSIDLGDWKVDHLCYRTSSETNYKEIKKTFLKLGHCLIESEVNKRLIATYKLRKTIEYKCYSIDVVEVAAPKIGSQRAEGFEHIEAVIDIPFKEVLQRFPECKFDKKGLDKEINPELVIKMDGCAIKFHHQSLEEIIEYEKSLS